MTDNLELIVGLIVGAGIVLLIVKMIGSKKTQTPNNDSKVHQQQILQLEKEKSLLQGKLEHTSQLNHAYSSKIEDLTLENKKLNQEVTSLTKDNQNLKIQKEELESLHDKFNQDFEAIANKIIRQNSKELSENHQKHLGDILLPFKESIHNFEKKVEEAYDKELRDKLSLKEEVTKLFSLNRELSKEAHNLTQALKGDNKKQGNWGELILERVLERSGLVKDREYKTQFSTKNIDQETIQPDVVVYLPENKHLIIDAKVSLVAYDNYLSATDEDEKEMAIKAHLLSFKNHIKLLSDKNYFTGANIDSPDFVLLFVPIESSFSLALQHDGDMFNYAWDRKIVIVSPTTLLATLRTIASVWKQEKQTKNVFEIARLAGTLYDKFVGFIDDMEKIEKGIDNTKKAYDNALKKLQYGNGNMIKTADKIRSLGAKANKQIPSKYIENEPQELDQ